MSSVTWSRSDKIAFVATTIAIVALVASFFVPEIRRAIGVHDTTEVTTPIVVTQPVKTSSAGSTDLQRGPPAESRARNGENVWIGEIKQSDRDATFPVIVRFPPVLDYGYIVRATYPTLGCEAKWKLVGVSILKRFTFQSTMTRGKCAPGTVVLKFINNEETSFSWHDDQGRTATGSLHPQ